MSMHREDYVAEGRSFVDFAKAHPLVCAVVAVGVLLIGLVVGFAL